MSELSDVAKASARGTFFLFIGITSSTVVLALTSILVARLLGPENYGLYTVVMITPTFFIALSDLGISPALTRFSARLRTEGKRRKAASLVKTGVLFKLLFSLLLSLVLILLSDTIATQIFRRPSIGLAIRFASLYLIGQAVYETVNSALIGLDKTEHSSFLMNVQATTKLLTSLLLIILGLNVVGATLGAGMGFLLAAGMGAIFLLLRTCPILYRGSSSEENIDSLEGLKLMVNYGMPLYLSTLILSLLNQYRSLTLALFVHDIDIGNCTTAMNFSVLITLISYPIAIALFPAFSKLNIDKDRNLVEKMFKLSVKYTSLLIIPASLALVVLAKDTVYTLYGSQYELAPIYLALYTLSFLCAGLGMFVVGNFFNGQGDTKSTFRINVINLVLSIPLTPILTFYHGVPGLIGSILASQLFSTVYGLSIAHRRYKVNIEWASSLKIGVASLSSALLVYILLRFAPLTNPIYCLAIGGSVYITSFLAFAPLLGAIGNEDIENLEELSKELTFIHPITRLTLSLEKKILRLKASLLKIVT